MMSNRCKKITAVLFDLDDTLLDWSAQTAHFSDIFRPHVKNICLYLEQRGHNLPEYETVFQCYNDTIVAHWNEAKINWTGVNFGNALTDCFTQLNLDVNSIDLNEVMLAYDCQPIPGVTPFDDAIPVLDKLKKWDYKIGLITNSMLPMWMRDVELRAYGLIDYFDARITSGDAGYIKPHPAIYNQMLSTLNVAPENAVFIGDRPGNDIAGANAAGITSILMSPPHLDRKLNGIVPDYIITSLTDLLPILKTVEEGEPL